MRQRRMLAAGVAVAGILAVVLVAWDSVWPDWTRLKAARC
jgi:hypothetical protein